MTRKLSRRHLLELSTGAAVAGAAARLPLAGAHSTRGEETHEAFDLTFVAGSDREGWRYSAATTSEQGFDLAGLSWGDRAPVRAQMRVRQGGAWGNWVTLGPIDDHLPDGAAPPSATSPAWFGRAHTMQVRTSRVPREPRVRLVSARSGAAVVSLRPIEAAPPFVPRESWNAQRPRVKPAYGEVRLAFVHHTVTANAYSPKDSAGIVRSIQEYHRNVLGWNDIGYNALIDRYGQIFEGREGGLDEPVIGAQAQGFNESSTGVAMLGTHTSDVPTAEAMEALVVYLAWKLSLHDVSPLGKAKVVSAGGETNRFPAGRHVALPRISGHRKGNLTACPGNALNRVLPELRRRVNKLTP